jgi:catechol 2,3-dioxygenase-like lactoylglutathione lyase family enzyme
VGYNVTGLEGLVFGVDDVDACVQYVLDYGLRVVDRLASGAIAEALDGTNVVIMDGRDAGLRPAVAATPNLREMVYGVDHQETLEAIGAELSKDRDVLLSNSRLQSVDDDGYPIAFQVSRRRIIAAPHYGINVPGQPPGRAHNQLGLEQDGQMYARTLSHVVIFTRDYHAAERFYAERLGFRTVDEFIGLGVFMRPAGTTEHHTLFLIETPTLGLQHFTFHLAGGNEVLQRGWSFVNKGYRSAWGPGRHLMGGNYFWYFNSPFGGWMEFDADMDIHNDDWKPRRIPVSAEASQAYLLQFSAKYAPGPKG